MNIIIFGGTGDLAARKLLPALFRLYKAKKLDGLKKENNIISNLNFNIKSCISNYVTIGCIEILIIKISFKKIKN